MWRFLQLPACAIKAMNPARAANNLISEASATLGVESNERDLVSGRRLTYLKPRKEVPDTLRNTFLVGKGSEVKVTSTEIVVSIVSHPAGAVMVSNRSVGNAGKPQSAASGLRVDLPGVD